MGVLSTIFQRKERTIEEAEAELLRLTTAVQEITSELQDLQSRLAAAEAKAGDGILEARLSGDQKAAKQIAAEIATLTSEIEISRRALESAKTARGATEKNVWLAKAAAKRKEASTLRAQAEERQKKTDALLKQLEGYEGVRYVPYRSPPLRPGVLCDETSKPARVPKTEWMLIQAEDLENEANLFEINAGVRK